MFFSSRVSKEINLFGECDYKNLYHDPREMKLQIYIYMDVER